MRQSGGKTALTMWPTVICLAILFAATLFEWYWVWGLLFLFWAVASIPLGQVFVIQTVRRDESPLLFWTISVFWVVVSVLVIVNDLFPEFLS